MVAAPTGPTPFLLDTFSGSGSIGVEISARASDIGGTWTALADDINSTAARAIQAQLSGGVTQLARAGSTTTRSKGYRHPATPPSAEYDITATWVLGITTGFHDSWVLGARLSTTGTSGSGYNRYAVAFVGVDGATPSRWELVKVVGGVVTTLDSVTESPALGTYTVKFEVRNATKRLYVDSGSGYILKLSSTDNSITQVGRVGAAFPRQASGNGVDNLAAYPA